MSEDERLRREKKNRRSRSLRKKWQNWRRGMSTSFRKLRKAPTEQDLEDTNG